MCSYCILCQVYDRLFLKLLDLEEIQEDLPTLCVWNATILVLTFLLMCPNLFAR
jgi:hypothetical protein